MKQNVIYTPFRTAVSVVLPIVLAMVVAIFFLPFYLFAVLVKNFMLLAWGRLKA